MVMLAACFGALAALVVVGALTDFDQYAVGHWMPGPVSRLTTATQSSGITHAFYTPFSRGSSWWQKVLELWTYPGSVLVSGVFVVVAYLLLARCRRWRAGVAWGAAWLVANMVEVASKRELHRPALYATSKGGARIDIEGFESSFPSGHAARSILVAALAAYLWRRVRWLALFWAALALPFLVVSAKHTPTDVIGGIFLGALTLFTARRAAVLTSLRPIARPRK
jgi:membrane-associated phospholipid phosphatase